MHDWRGRSWNPASSLLISITDLAFTRVRKRLPPFVVELPGHVETPRPVRVVVFPYTDAGWLKRARRASLVNF
jgi:hypothetical protein